MKRTAANANHNANANATAAHHGSTVTATAAPPPPLPSLPINPPATPTATNCPLLGIALVVGSSRGHHIVAHYPPNPPSPAQLAAGAQGSHHLSFAHHGHTHTSYKALATAPLHGSAPLALAKESLATPLAALLTDMPSYGTPHLVPPISKRGSIAFASEGGGATAVGGMRSSAGPTTHDGKIGGPGTTVAGMLMGEQSATRPTTAASTTTKSTTTAATTDPSQPTSQPTTTSATSLATNNTLLGFELPLLADLLAPKPACCDTPFELTVGNVQFLGLPVGLTGAKLAPVCGRYPGMAPYYKHRMARYMRDEDTEDENEKEPAAGDASPNTSSSSSTSLANGQVVYNSSDDEHDSDKADGGGGPSAGGRRSGAGAKGRHKKRSSFGGSMAFAQQQQHQVCSTDSDWDGGMYTTGDDDGNDTDVDDAARSGGAGRVHFSPPWKGSPAGASRRLSVPMSTAPNTPALKSVDLAVDSDSDDPAGVGGGGGGGLARSKSHPGQYRKWATPRRRSDGSAPPSTSIYEDAYAASRRRSSAGAPGAGAGADSGLPPPGGSSSSARLHINMFHVVFILADLGPGSREWAESLYTHVAVPLTWALRHEQLRHEFVAREAAIALRDRSSGGGGASGISGGARHSGASAQNQPQSHSRGQSASSYMHHMDHLSSGSTRCELNHLLAQTYTAILADAPAHLLVNNHINVTIQVPPRRVPTANSVLITDELEPDVDFDSVATLSDFPMFGDPLPWDLARPRPTPGLVNNLPWDALEPDPVALAADPGGASRPGYFPLIRSYHSLAFVGDRDAILARLPSDASPLVADFVRWFKPSVSFTEAHIHFQVPLYQLLRVAAHLIFWGMARLIHPISLRSVVAVDPECDMVQLSIAASHPDASPLARDFHNQFPGLDLIDFISQLTTGPPRFLSAHVPSRDLRSTYQDAVAFLVARGILIQLHTFVLLKVPAILVRMPHLSLSDFEQLCGTEGSSAVLGATAGASGAQGMPRPEQIKCTLPATIPWVDMPLGVREWVRLVAATQPGNLAAVFERVAPYFTGRFHTDEIMYRTGTVRKDLKAVLAAYAGEVVTVLHA
ncbi:nitrogen permease regulator of amino acid transport activity 3-domain-containing protein [Catenaria anguillulae PL171]|uniref:Nitrogen permease regulator 3 n=1 Tax=Catenaria anguillulae PL171 TaxID=765915 RepID=A0A1Y2I287_9FUNG|nr:nitrogen permease regulator of amino acid transport activity 3-domain-containing protein [Catenaria anguillulae PL171]